MINPFQRFLMSQQMQGQQQPMQPQQMPLMQQPMMQQQMQGQPQLDPYGQQQTGLRAALLGALRR